MLMKKAQTESTVYIWRASLSRKVLKSFNEVYTPVLCDMLKQTTHIKRLGVGGFLNDVGLKNVCNIIQHHNTITEVMIMELPCKKTGSDIGKLILHKKNLTSLHCTVGNEDIEYIANALPHTSSLTRLGLTNDLPDPDYIHCDSEEDFDVNYKLKLGYYNKAMRILSTGLLHNHSITKIDLGSNCIGDEGAKVLCSVCEVNHTITDIDFGENQIVRLPKDFAFLTHINKLNLRNNRSLIFPPKHVVEEFDEKHHQQFHKLLKFFAEFRCSRMKFHFLIGFNERVGKHSSIQSYLCGSTIFEPALISCVFEMLP